MRQQSLNFWHEVQVIGPRNDDIHREALRAERDLATVPGCLVKVAQAISDSVLLLLEGACQSETKPNTAAEESAKSTLHWSDHSEGSGSEPSVPDFV